MHRNCKFDIIIIKTDAIMRLQFSRNITFKLSEVNVPFTTIIGMKNMLPMLSISMFY